MQTVIETEIFKKAADQLLTEDERLNFISWIAVHPKSGDVIPGANGARKIRWSCGNKGKRGGVRIIYLHYTEQNQILLLTIYAKSDQTTINPQDIPHGH